MKSKHLITLSFLFFGYFGISQKTSNGEVISVFPFGAKSYSFILKTGTDHYYKTSPHENGELIQGQIVEILFNQTGNSPNSIQINTPTLTKPLFCQRQNKDELNTV